MGSSETQVNRCLERYALQQQHPHKVCLSLVRLKIRKVSLLLQVKEGWRRHFFLRRFLIARLRCRDVGKVDKSPHIQLNRQQPLGLRIVQFLHSEVVLLSLSPRLSESTVLILRKFSNHLVQLIHTFQILEVLQDHAKSTYSLDDPHQILACPVEEMLGPLHQFHVLLYKPQVLHLQLLEEFPVDLQLLGRLVSQADEIVLVQMGDMGDAAIDLYWSCLWLRHFLCWLKFYGSALVLGKLVLLAHQQFASLCKHQNYQIINEK